jgi:hypothetical protein
MIEMKSDRNHIELVSILNNIERRPELATFFNRLEDDPNVRTLLMLHPHDLFISSDDFIIPFLFSTSSTSTDESLVLSLISDLDFARFQKAFKSFPFQLDNLSRVFLDLVAYGAITLARKNEDINNLITGDFSYTEMKRVLGKLDFNKTWNEIDNTINESKDQSLLQAKKELEASAKNWINELKSNPTKVLESLLDMRIPNFYFAIHQDADSHVGSLLKKTNMNLEEYNQVLSLLYALKLINRQDSVFRCDECIDEPQLLNSSSMIGPNKMNINCPRCGQQMNYSAILWFDNFLRNCLLNKDGLLQIAIGNMLKKMNITFNSSVKDNKFEYDFICQTKKGKVLVECKVHRFPESERSVKGSIEQDLQQGYKHMQELKIQMAVVIYNYDLTKYEDLVEKGTEKYGIDLIDFGEASAYFRSFIS